MFSSILYCWISFSWCVWLCAVQIELLIVGWSRNLPKSWAEFSGRGGEGRWQHRELWGWPLLTPQCTFSTFSTFLTKNCPTQCVLWIERCSQVFAATAGVKCTFWCGTHRVPRAANLAKNQFPHPCLFKIGVTSLENDISWGKSCTV